MMKKRLKISKKIYVPPLVEFEEIDAELMEGDVIEGSVAPWKKEEDDEDPLSAPTSANDFDFSMDFVVNDEPQL